MENNDLFESQLKEILDSGPAKQNPVPLNEFRLPENKESVVPVKNQSGSLIELIVRIAALVAVIGLLIGFALRVTSF